MKQYPGIELPASTPFISATLKKRNFDIGQFFGNLPSWALFAYIDVAGMLLVGLGTWIGNLWSKMGVGPSESSISTAVGAILGLLAFILGFTFFPSSPRYPGAAS